MCDLVLEQLAEAQAQAAQLTGDGQVSGHGSGLGQPPRQPTAVSPTYAYGPCVVRDWGVLRGALGNLSACPGAVQLLLTVWNTLSLVGACCDCMNSTRMCDCGVQQRVGTFTSIHRCGPPSESK